MRVLAPGDRVEKLVEQALIHQAADDRARELVALAKFGGIIAGQTVALSLGADPKAVQAVAEALAEGGGADGE